MPTTTNFGWTTPADTDLVKDGALAIRTLGNGIDTSLVDLKGGTTGQVLSKASNTDMDFTWVAQDDSNAIQNAIVDAKGDLISATAADTPARLAVGTNGQVLTADSTTSTGLKWATPSGGDWILVTASAASSVSSHSISSCFSSTYKVYKIYLNLTGSTGASIAWRGRVGSTDTTTNYNYQLLTVANTTFYNGSTVGGTSALCGDVQTYFTGAEFTIYDPYAAAVTPAHSLMVGDAGSARFYTSRQTDSTSFDGITFIAGSGTFTGTFYVYGLKA